MDTKNPNITISDTVKKPQEQEIDGFENKLEPTRYGDWEVNGRCSDF